MKVGSLLEVQGMAFLGLGFFRGRRSSLGPSQTEMVVLKAQLLCTSAESNLGDRVLGEVENSFIALPGKGRCSRLLPQKTMCPYMGGFGEEL